MHAKFATVFAASLVLAAPAIGLAQEETRPVVADTYVESTMPGTNFGSADELAAGKGSFWGLGFGRIYLMFDLSDLTNPDQIETATLRIFQHRTEPAAGGLGDDVFALLSDWDESTVTWDTKPANGDRAGNDSRRVGASGSVGWLDYDVSALVRDIVGGAPNNGFAVAQLRESTAGASRYGYFRSSEFSDATLHPELVLVLRDTCRVDLDGDGDLTIFDFLAFQNAFDAGDLAADFDGDGSLTIFDFLAFQNEFDAGC
ncbi:MAG: DNRLRE domain-containing protein [Phycisphaera sp.]|nr:MAG: DNRLRE domain-containing protein [Phycisphaera sp.]